MLATKTQTDAQKEAEKVAKEAGERKAALDKADADFREAVAKGAEAREKIREKYPDLGNVAELAWNETKPVTDPDYVGCSLTFRQKLDATVDTIKATGNADEIGLKDFEKRVVELLVERELPVAGVVKAREEEKAKAKTALSVPSTHTVESAKTDDQKRFANARQETADRKATDDKKQAEDKKLAEAKAKQAAKRR